MRRNLLEKHQRVLQKTQQRSIQPHPGFAGNTFIQSGKSFDPSPKGLQHCFWG
jgi:hypothetical protein